jgi:hypothetical protein
MLLNIRGRYYLSAVDTLVKAAFSVVPMLSTAARITIEIPAAISAYSMAVAPELSLKKRPTSLRMTRSFVARTILHRSAFIAGQNLP